MNHNTVGLFFGSSFDVMQNLQLKSQTARESLTLTCDKVATWRSTKM